MCWCPDDGPIRKKMLYSSSFDTLKKAYVGHKKVKSKEHCSELFYSRQFGSRDKSLKVIYVMSHQMKI